MKLLVRIYVNILQATIYGSFENSVYVYAYTRTHALTHRDSYYMHAVPLSRLILKRLLM
jgi:hypothetical protein